MQNRQPVEPLAGVSRVERFRAVKYVGENVLNFTNWQGTLLQE
jgi:hypothetical protein